MIVSKFTVLPLPCGKAVREIVPIVPNHPQSSSIMKKQSSKWSSLAFGYISDIIMLVHRMVTDLLKEVTPDDNMRVAIESLLIGELRRRYREAISLTEFLIQVELEGNPATHNHYFNDTLEKWCVWNALCLFCENAELLANSAVVQA